MSNRYLMRPVFALFLASSALLLYSSGMPAALDDFGGPLIIALVGFMAAWSAGLFVARLFVKESCWMEEALAGYFVISVYILIIGSFGILSHALAALPIFILPLLSLRTIARRISQSLRRFDVTPAQLGPINSALLFIIVTALLWQLIGVMAPPAGMDCMTYHLGLPRQFLLRGSIAPADSLGYYYYWQQFGMALMPLLAVEQNGIAANITCFFFFIALVGGVSAIAIHLSGRRAALIVSTAIVTSPIGMVVLLHTKDDIMSHAALCWGVYSWMCAEQEEDALGKRRMNIWGALLVGASVAVKPTALLFALPVTLWRLSSVRCARTFLLVIVAVCLLPSYWAVRNLVMVGNVLAPNIVDTLPSASSGLTATHAEELVQYESDSSAYVAIQSHATDADTGATSPMHTYLLMLKNRARHLAESFFVVKQLNIDGPLGPILLFLCVSAFFGAECRMRKMIFSCGMVSLVLWFVIGRGQARFLMPALSLLAVSGAVFVAEQGRKLVLVTVLAGLVTLGAGIKLSQRNLYVYLYHAGTFDMASYLLNYCNSYPYILKLNESTSPDATIFSFGESRLFYLDRKAIFDGYWEQNRAMKIAHASHSPEELWRACRAEGITHIIYNEPTYFSTVGLKVRPPPFCPKDSDVFRAMLSSETYAVALMENRKGDWVGAYELKEIPR